MANSGGIGNPIFWTYKKCKNYIQWATHSMTRLELKKAVSTRCMYGNI